jgi:hypothetical protein
VNTTIALAQTWPNKASAFFSPRRIGDIAETRKSVKKNEMRNGREVE